MFYNTKTRWKNIIRNIRGSLNRFLSILFIVALGAGFMAGLAAASPDMYDAADQYIRDYHLYDLDLKSAAGFTTEDLQQVSEMDSVAGIQPARVFDMILSDGENSDFTSRVYGILNTSGQTGINSFRLLEGRLPEAPGECVVESVFGKYSEEEVHPGDVLSLAEGNTEYEMLKGYLSSTDLTIVGICQSPLCISIEGDSTNIGSGTINLNVYAPLDLFTCDFYTDLFLTAEGADQYNSFSDSYEAAINTLMEELKPLGRRLATDRSGDLEEELTTRLEELDRLSERVRSISETQELLAKDRKDRIAANREVALLLPGIKDLLDPVALPEDSVSPEDPDSPEDSVLSEGSYSAAGLQNFLAESRKEVTRTLDTLQDLTWIYRTRKDLAGFESYSNNVGKVSALAKIFPVFFFIVALLVALTTMSRLIEENRLQIGTLKALGYSNGQILFEYLLFSFTASVLGCILGFGIGFRIFPAAINGAYSMMYMLPSMETPFRWNIAAWVAPVTILSILIAALLSCWNEFRSVPAVLMLPKAPAAGKRIWLEHIGFIWKRLSFTYKVTCRNLFRYKKRFIMTIIGVAGCSALLLTGFGVKDSVNDIVDKQFGEIYRYNQMFVLDHPLSDIEDPDLTALLNDQSLIHSVLSTSQETGKLYTGGTYQELTLCVPEEETLFPDFISLRERVGQTPLELSPDGVILTEKLCEEMHIRPGDLVTLEDSQGHQSSAQVTAITENYVSSFAYMTADTYQALFHKIPDYTCLLCIQADGETEGAVAAKENTAGVEGPMAAEGLEAVKDPTAVEGPATAETAGAIRDVTAEILTSSHVLFGRSVDSLKDSFSDSIESINGVIYVLILAAGLLCIVVLYNLINVNICERRKELATLRVLGFYKTETQNYIFRETNILSFLGALVGLLVGIWLHSYVVRTVEVNHIMFGREIRPLSFVIALAISIVFTLIVDLIMKRSINRTDMVEAMKAND
ncbi:MAG: ABC transporter permease [Parasporobacterium sp.]|nr:ABC transporter permease [Parasporobacterium sp.]